jgi:flagellar L-ring protein precursor FlgH
MMKKFAGRILLAVVFLALPAAPCAHAQKKRGKKGEPPAPVEATQGGERYADEQPAPAPRANGSLFTDEASGGNLFDDFRPRRVGDLVFVDVVESSEASVSSNAKRGRDSGTLGGIVGAAGALPVPGAAVIAGVAGGLGSRKFEGKGSTGRQSDLRARIAARVVEVLPNGDMRVEAQKFVKINKEDERLQLSGIVRRRDVSAQNSVPTTAVGDLRVELNGKGVASADNAPGWLFRLFEKIAPF